jgi:hypothetical protein
MMKLASLASLLVASAVGCASTPAPAPTTPATPAPATAPAAPDTATLALAPAPACTGGDVLFEVDLTNLAAGPDKNVLYTGGAWRHEAAGGGTKTGCLNATDLATIRRDAASPWTTTPRTGIQCHAVHTPNTYSVNGKAVYVDTGCGSPVLDDLSQHALVEMMLVLQNAEAG